MRALLDSHTSLWFVLNDSQLSSDANALRRHITYLVLGVVLLTSALFAVWWHTCPNWEGHPLVGSWEGDPPPFGLITPTI
jgi:hypothetical protein